MMKVLADLQVQMFLHMYIIKKTYNLNVILFCSSLVNNVLDAKIRARWSLYQYVL